MAGLFSLRTRQLIVAMASLWVIAPTLEAQAPQSIDLASAVRSMPAGSDSDRAILIVEYSNLGDFAPYQAVVNLNFPDTYGFDWDEATQVEVADSFVDSNGGLYGLYDQSTCIQKLIQVQGENIGIDLPADSTGSFSVTVPRPRTGVRRGVLRIEAPEELAGELVHGIGSCFDCRQDPDGNLLHCFGPRLPFAAARPLTLSRADDGSEDPTLGCFASQKDLTGTITLIRRGTCEFGLKALNAEDAGARGVIIMNDRVQDVTTFAMSAGDFGELVTIPVAMVDMEVGDALEAAVVGGTLVVGTLGGVEADDVVFESQIFHTANSADTDPEPGNDRDVVAVFHTFIFLDGFESGDSSHW